MFRLPSDLDSTVAHVARDLRLRAQVERMANKLKLLKLLQEMRGFSQLTQRRAPAKPGLFLLQLRAHLNQAPRRQRLTIPIQMFEPIDIPSFVKITHIKSSSPVSSPQ